jgi:hypothetical protein
MRWHLNIRTGAFYINSRVGNIEDARKGKQGDRWKSLINSKCGSEQLFPIWAFFIDE